MSDIAATPATTRACSVEHEESSSGSSTPLKQVSSQTANGSPKLPASDVAASQETEKHPKGKRKRTRCVTLRDDAPRCRDCADSRPADHDPTAPRTRLSWRLRTSPTPSQTSRRVWISLPACR